MIGKYGDFRRSFRPGHLHAGIDLQGEFGEFVYSIGQGLVFDVYNGFPHKTIVIRHYIQGGGSIFSVYTHVEDIKVKAGDRVDPKTVLARLFYEEELKAANFGTPNHLHLEIRKNFGDKGEASYSSQIREELDKFCFDPLVFFQEHLKIIPDKI